MATDATLIEACRLARDDDAPRLVWADHVGGERGELVVVQCELARGERPPAEMAALRRRERELLAQHGAAWAGLRPYASRWVYRRGFVEAAEIEVATFVASDAAIFETAPLLTSLRATGLTGSFDDDDGVVRGPETLELVRQLFDCPGFWQLDGIEVVGAGVNESGGGGYGRRFSGLGDQVAALLAESGALGQLRALGFAESDLGARGVHALVASHDLARLESLRLREIHDLGVDATLALLRAAPNLRSLALGVRDLDEVAPALGPLRELELRTLAAGDFATLSRSPAARTVESLQLIGDVSPSGAFASWPRLRSLDLRVATLGAYIDRNRPPIDVTAFAATPIPTLRRLRCSARTPPGALLAIARAFGPQLELLDANGAQGVDADELSALVAGEVLLAPIQHEPRLL